MALLKSYSCVKCGGILNFDENQEIFDCPFCGGEYTFTDFHREDLLKQAESCLKKGSFATAQELYQTILDKNSRDFEALRGKILAAGKIHSIDKFHMIEDLASADFKSAEKAALDAKASLEEESRYFELLAKMLSSAGEYHLSSGSFDERSETVRKEYRELEYVRTGFQENLDMAYKNFGGFALIFGIVCTVMAMRYDKVWPLLMCGAVLLIIFIAIKVISKICENNMLKKQGEHIGKFQQSGSSQLEKMNESREAYTESYTEFKKLSPDARLYAMPKASGEKTEDGISVEHAAKELVCSKCGGLLSLNSEKKLYECRSCGVAYGASLFFDEPLKKAVKALRAKEYQEANKRFSYMLMMDSADPKALLGIVISAGHWQCLNDILLSDAEVAEEELLKSCANEAVLKSSDDYKAFFEDLQKLVEMYCEYVNTNKIVKEYSDKLAARPRNRDPHLVNRRREIVLTQSNLNYRFTNLKNDIVRGNKITLV